MTKKIFNSDLETSGQVVASTLTDGTATISGGVLTASTITDGTATLSGGVLTVDAITASSTINVGSSASPVSEFNVYSDAGAVNIVAGTLSVANTTISGSKVTGVNASFEGDLSLEQGIVECKALSSGLLIGEDYPAAAPISYGFINLPDTKENTANTNTELKIGVTHYQGISSVVDGEGGVVLEARGRADSLDEIAILEVNSTDGITISATKGNVAILPDITGGSSNEVVIREKIGIKRDLGLGHTESSRYPYLEAQLNETDGTTERWDLYLTAGTSTDSVSGGGDANTLTLDNKKLSIGHAGDPFITFDDSELFADDKIKFAKGATFQNSVSFESSLVNFDVPNLKLQHVQADGSSVLSVPYNNFAGGYDLIVNPLGNIIDQNSTGTGGGEGLPTLCIGADTAGFTGVHRYYSDATDLTLGASVEITSDRKVTLSTNPSSSLVIGIVGYIADLSSEQSNAILCDSFGTKIASANSPYLVHVLSVGDTTKGEVRGFNVCNENGDVQPGDLLVTSSTPGYLMKQDDDIIRSKTVGKAMEAVTFDGNGQATGVYGFIYCG
jgi:hypothetical protein